MKGKVKASLAALAAAVMCLTVAVGGAWAADVVRIGVLQFYSKTPNVSQGQAEAITDFFSRALSDSKSIALIERERLASIGRESKLSMSGLVDPSMAVEVGRLAGCQYMILGSVTSLTVDKSSFAFSVVGQASEKANATVDMRVLDVTTGEIVMAIAETGTAESTAQVFQLGGMQSGEVKGGDLQARAIENAVTKLANRIREEFAGEYAQVVSVSGKNVNISLGATSGVKRGDLYMVYAEGAEMFHNGESLGKDVIYIAVVKVSDVRGKFSVCQVVPGGGKLEAVQQGDKVEPISQSDAGDLAKRKVFVSERPRRRAYDDTAAQLFGGGSQPSGPQPSAAAASAPSTAEPQAAPQASPQPSQPAAPTATKPAKSGGFENESTNPTKVIPTYGLAPGDANILTIAHNGLKGRTGKAAYAKYSELAASYPMDYLAMYRAGVLARQMKKNDDAKAWLNKALAVNPNYKPAIDELGKIK
ncbi:MAG: hypothetical protein LBR38_09540 [Synergistaceae bacterium]|jgi:curli biogenesis system outer membrane secretion channel CsgG|nr:hypothetical protein [Synergistaceae bacterium]